MTYTKDQIVAEFTARIQRSGAKYWTEWYVGISKDARNRLFDGHSVTEKGDWWIYRQANSSTVARAVQPQFVNTQGTDGATGGGDQDSDIVYACKKATHTNP